VTSLVDHDLTEDGAKQSAVAVGDALCLDVQIAGAYRSLAGHVQAASEQRVVEARHGPAHVLVEVVLTTSCLVVGVQRQLIHVVHVVTVRRRCRRVLCNKKTSTAKPFFNFAAALQLESLADPGFSFGARSPQAPRGVRFGEGCPPPKKIFCLGMVHFACVHSDT